MAFLSVHEICEKYINPRTNKPYEHKAINALIRRGTIPAVLHYAGGIKYWLIDENDISLLNNIAIGRPKKK